MIFKNKKEMLPKVVYMFLITTSLVTTFTFSKYQSTVANSSTANAAGFIVNVKFKDDAKELILDCKNNYNPLPNAQYEVVVTNKNEKNKVSQVGMEYSIVVTLPQPLPEGVSMSISDAQVPEITNNNTVYTFKSNNVFLPGEEKTYSNIVTFTASEDIIGYHTLNNININIITEQVD